MGSPSLVASIDRWAQKTTRDGKRKEGLLNFSSGDSSRLPLFLAQHTLFKVKINVSLALFAEGKINQYPSWAGE